MCTVKVALIQMDIGLGQVEKNRKKGLQLLDEAAKIGAKLVAFPELWTTGYDLENLNNLKVEEHKKTLTIFKEKAQQLNINIFLGSIIEPVEGKFYNTSYFIDFKGKVVANYKKVHLFGLMEEDKFLEPGEEIKAFSNDEFGKLGMMICYDLRFPELARKMTLQGAKAFFIPAEFPNPRKNHWRILNQARAIENQAFVFAINRVGEDKKSTFFGNSMIIDPWGEILAEGGEKEEIVLADVDFSLVDKIRQTIPSLEDRRPKYY